MFYSDCEYDPSVQIPDQTIVATDELMVNAENKDSAFLSLKVWFEWLGVTFCTGTIIIICWYMKKYDNRKLYKKALDKISKANIHNISYSNETNYRIVSTLNTAKVANISQIENAMKRFKWGTSFKGRNLVISKYYILINNIWKDPRILKRMNISKYLKYVWGCLLYHFL